jgi:hypothetical protein
MSGVCYHDPYLFFTDHANTGLESVLPQTPWGGHEDYDFPASVGPVSLYFFAMLPNYSA